MEGMELYYEQSTQELKRRILVLIPTNPHIMEMADPFQLFRIPGFNCDDLSPSLAMSSMALSLAKEEYGGR